MIDPLYFFWLVLRASLLSTGIGNVPILRANLVDPGLVTDQEFAEALAISQISPGPTGLWVVALGYLVDGARGAMLALVGIVIPPLAVLAINRVFTRYGHRPAMQGFIRGLGLSVAGVFLVVIAGFMRSAGITPATVAIALGALGLGLTRRVPVLAVLALAGLVGAILLPV